MHTSRRAFAGPLALAGALVLAGCSGTPADGSVSSPVSTPVASPPASTTAASAAPGGSPVHCSGTSCSVTLTGDVTSVDVLGTPVTFGGVTDGQATIGVGGRRLSCRQGESVSAGPLRLTCTTVQRDRVTLTAGLGG